MKNIFKKSLFIMAGCLLATAVWASDAKFGFESDDELNNNFTYSCEYSNGSMTIVTDKKNGGNASLKANMGGSGGKSNFLVTNESFPKISKISFYLASSDKGKTELGIEYCAKADFSSDVKTLLALTTYSSLPGMPSSVSNGTFYEVSITPSGPISGYLRFTFRQPSSSGKNLWMDDLTITYEAGPSSDATLKSLTYNGTEVPGFSGDVTGYDVVLPAGTTTVPTVVGVANDEKAKDVTVTDATGLPGTTTVTVTAENGDTKTYSILFTVDDGKPVVKGCDFPNRVGLVDIDHGADNGIGTIKAKIKFGSDRTAIAPTFTGKNIDNNWGPIVPQDFTNGPVTFMFTYIGGGNVKSYQLYIDESDPVSDDATLRSLTVAGYDIEFAPDKFTYEILLPTGTTTPPAVSYELNDEHANAVKTGASGVPGQTKIVVTAEDGVTVLTYTIIFKVNVPPSGLVTHVPEIYEAKTIAKGYGGTLSPYNGREYEVYYAGKTNDSQMTVDVKPNQKQQGIAIDNTATSCKAPDGWFVAATTSISNYSNTKMDEFIEGTGSVHKMQGCSYKMDVSGFDQFSILAKDKNVDMQNGAFKKDQRFQIFIDKVMQAEDQAATSVTVRRYDLTPGQHTIEVKALDGGASEFYGFSLRVSDQPRTKRLAGNDSSQVVLQTNRLNKILYYTKNGSKGETRLEWDGAEVSDIKLENISKDGGAGDTLALTGLANCPVGTYRYHVASYYNGIETSRVNGKFEVQSGIRVYDNSDINPTAYIGEEMEEILFRYFALTPEDVHLTWLNGKPEGVTDGGANGIYTISGIITADEGNYPYEITVTGSNTVITGSVEVKAPNWGNDPILYLHKNMKAYDDDGIYQYLVNDLHKNVMPRKTRSAGLRTPEEYSKYKWVLISDDADADNAEVLDIIRGGANLPVLNMNAFTYAAGRLDWGDPQNGTLDTTSHNGLNIYIQRSDHPIFYNKDFPNPIKIFKETDKNTVMPIRVKKQGSHCLATAYTRDINDYFHDGELQTILHEIPAAARGQKYLCFPISGACELTENGKKLLNSIVSYLTNDVQSPVTQPTLQINAFLLEGINGNINQEDNTIEVVLNSEQFEELDSLRSATPVIAWEDTKYTSITPSPDKPRDFRFANILPVVYTVTDYINRRPYSVSLRIIRSQGIDEVYTSGDWVTVYDIYGRKVATTNEDIYTMPLPRGMYIVLTESGQTIKLMR